ncbi:unnamed protein product [Acanthosepion pharaonis]|uniref:Uncharacterized protein n=1 Tax=Acanthosepion pharaonis TaxID=158019 RepID=A0A812E200_ACAPH|nr:unnamed protein product [Sepia pharaonis]
MKRSKRISCIYSNGRMSSVVGVGNLFLSFSAFLSPLFYASFFLNLYTLSFPLFLSPFLSKILHLLYDCRSSTVSVVTLVYTLSFFKFIRLFKSLDFYFSTPSLFHDLSLSFLFLLSLFRVLFHSFFLHIMHLPRFHLLTSLSLSFPMFFLNFSISFISPFFYPLTL